MPVSPTPNPPAALNYNCLELITDSFIEIGAVPPGENPSPEEAQWAFRKLNDLCDFMQAQEKYVWSYGYSFFNTVAGLNPHLIGPSPAATWSTNGQPRPVRFKSASWILNDASAPSGTVFLPINLRDRQWYSAQQVPNIQTNISTDLYYDPTSPDGSIYFWPVPNIINPVRLELWQTVSQFTNIQQPIGGPGGPGTLPPAYRTMLKLTLAEMLCPGAARTPSPVLIENARQARVAVFGNNAKSPRIQTCDSGMPRAGSRPGTRQDFNWAYGNYPGGRPQ
jgi:hypothetical protein